MPSDPSSQTNSNDSGEHGAHPATAMVRHLVAVLAYRTQKALRAAPSAFSDFDGGSGLRTPLQILQHLNALIGWTTAQLTGDEHTPVDDDWPEAVRRMPRLLATLDTALAAQAPPTALLERLLQGPLSDAMTHAGQLAMLRRMAGSPIAGESFFDADIRTGKIDYPEAGVTETPASDDRGTS